MTEILKGVLAAAGLAFTLAIILGWIANIVKLFGLWNSALTGELLFRITGIPLFPLGAVLGFL